MASPLARYVTLTYAKYFVPLLVPFAVVALPVALDFRIMYVMILPLAVVDLIAFAGTLLLLASRGELETLQVYGVPERSVAGPLALATCAPLAAFGRGHSIIQQPWERATVRGDWTNRDNLRAARRRSPMLETALGSVSGFMNRAIGTQSGTPSCRGWRG